MLFTIVKTNYCISLSCLPSGLQSCFQGIWSFPVNKISLEREILISDFGSHFWNLELTVSWTTQKKWLDSIIQFFYLQSSNDTSMWRHFAHWKYHNFHLRFQDWYFPPPPPALSANNSPLLQKASRSNPRPHFLNCIQNDVTLVCRCWNSFRK